MSFHTDVVAINLRDYPHSPQLLTDLGREGYELFDPTGYVFFRRYNRLASTPVAAMATDVQADPPAIDYDRLAAAVAAALADRGLVTEQEYGPECDYGGRDDGPND